MTFSHWLRKALNRTATTGAPRRHERRHRLALELLEDRTLLSGAAFDPVTGWLSISGAAAQVAVAPDGTLAVTVDGKAEVALARAADLHGISVNGAGTSDMLTLGGLTTSGGLTVSSDGGIAVDGAVNTTGWLTMTAAGHVDIDAGALLHAQNLALSGQVVVNSGQLSADGARGGQVSIRAANFENSGSITANGQAGDGGTVQVAFTGAYRETIAGLIAADGGPDGHGGQVTIDGGATGSLFSSGTHEARGVAGGSISILGMDISLVDAGEDTSAGSTSAGPLLIRASHDAEVSGRLTAHGGTAGGTIEVSAGGTLTYGADADAGASAGTAGSLLLDPKNLVIGSAQQSPPGAFPQYNLVDPNLAGENLANAYPTILPLSTGNIVFADRDDSFGGPSAGAAFLFNGQSGALISMLIGNAGDEVGSGGVTALAHGNYLIGSSFWNDSRGAATWGNGTTGVSGTVSAANSIVGSHVDDQVGDFSAPFGQVTVLNNGGYVLSSPVWNGETGAVTWGAAGVFGPISAANSLIGTSMVNVYGYGEFDEATITPLSNGNYVVSMPYWNALRGAVAWGNGQGGLIGPVSAANSLVGSAPGDAVGTGTGTPGVAIGITVLSDGNYVISSFFWNDYRGAATWVNGTQGLTGTISAANSLVGTAPNDLVGLGVAKLANGNYVVNSPYWGSTGAFELDGLGAATWGNGSTGVTGAVSAANSLVGTNPRDSVGGSATTIAPGNIVALSNGNYLVISSGWNSSQGAVTWGNGTIGIAGAVSAANSLVGDNGTDGIGTVTALASGNYVVSNQNGYGGLGSVTWGSGSTGIAGPVSAANSLVGTTANPGVGGTVTDLGNGDYVAVSPDWSGGLGAVTWVNGSGPVTGTVSAANSLVGATVGDDIGVGDGIGGANGITVLTIGNYVVSSPDWNQYRGAVTWASGNGGTVGQVSAANSLVGTNIRDYVGGYDGYSVAPVVALANGNYVVNTPGWNGGLGAVTWGSGTAGVVGPISAAISLVGANANDQIGSDGVTALTNGSYVVVSTSWNNRAGAATWGGSTGVAGVVSAANSLVGSAAPDEVGSGRVTALPNGNFVVSSPNIEAVTWGSGASGVQGAVSTANSLVGAAFAGVTITILSTGDYLISTYNSNANQSAVTWVNGASGQTLDGSNIIEPQNSLVSGSTNSFIEFNTPVEDTVNHTFIVLFTGVGSRFVVGLTDPNLLTFGRAVAQTISITADFVASTLDTGTAVTLQASNDITVNSPIVVNNPAGTGGALTLDTGRSILLNAGIDTGGGNLSLIANDTVADGVIDSERDPGNAYIELLSGATLNTGSGTLSIDIKHSTDKINNAQGAAFLTSLNPASTTLSSTTALGFILNGTTPGDGVAPLTYTQMQVTGALNLAGIALEVIHAPTGPTAGDTFTIIHTTGGVTGTFTGLPEGATVTAQDGSQFTISYLANGGDDVTLTAVTPSGFSYDPTSMTLTISAGGANFTYFQGSAVDASGTLHTTYDFTLNGATIAYPDSHVAHVVVNAQGSSNEAILIANDTYVGADGLTHEMRETAWMRPGGGILYTYDASGNAITFLQLNGFNTSYAYVGRADSAQVSGVAGSGIENIFVTAGNYSYVTGGGQFHLVSGSPNVYGYAANSTDQAWHYDAAGSLDAFVASGNAYSYMSGSDTSGHTFFNVAVGFQVTYGIATHGNAIAYMLDSPGNDTFFGSTTYSYLSGSDSTGSLFNVAEGFALVYAESFVGGTDFAYNHDPNHNILNSRWILLT